MLLLANTIGGIHEGIPIKIGPNIDRTMIIGLSLTTPRSVTLRRFSELATTPDVPYPNEWIRYKKNSPQLNLHTYRKRPNELYPHLFTLSVIQGQQSKLCCFLLPFCRGIIIVFQSFLVYPSRGVCGDIMHFVPCTVVLRSRTVFSWSARDHTRSHNTQGPHQIHT